MSTNFRLFLYKAGKSDREIARIVGRHHETIREWRTRRGLAPNSTRNRPAGDLARRLALHRAGMTDPEIAAQEGVTRCTIRIWRERRGLPLNCREAQNIDAPSSVGAQSLDLLRDRSWVDNSWSEWLERMGATVSRLPAVAAGRGR